GRARMWRLSRTVSDGRIWRSGGTKPIPKGAGRKMGSPSSRVSPSHTSPRCSVVCPITVPRSVLLPTPFRPITLMLSPGSRASVRSSSTTVSPYPAEAWRSASASAAMGLAQVDRAHLRVCRDLVGSAAGEHGPAHEDRDLFREAEDEIHVVLDDQHADVRGQFPDGVEDDVALGARHARGRLVE